jgi:hypothetical protein
MAMGAGTAHAPTYVYRVRLGRLGVETQNGRTPIEGLAQEILGRAFGSIVNAG